MATISETSPLLRQISRTSTHSHIPHRHGALRKYDTADNSISKDYPKTTWRAESALLARYSAPLVITYVLQYDIQALDRLV